MVDFEVVWDAWKGGKKKITITAFGKDFFVDLEKMEQVSLHRNKKREIRFVGFKDVGLTPDKDFDEGRGAFAPDKKANPRGRFAEDKDFLGMGFDGRLYIFQFYHEEKAETGEGVNGRFF